MSVRPGGEDLFGKEAIGLVDESENSFRFEQATMARATGRGFGIAQRVIANCFSFLVPVIAGFFADRWFLSAPVFVLVGVFLGMALGGINLFYFVKFLQAEAPQATGSTGDAAAQPDSMLTDSMLRKAHGHEGRTAESAELEDEEPEVDPWEQRWKDKWGEGSGDESPGDDGSAREKF